MLLPPTFNMFWSITAPVESTADAVILTRTCGVQKEAYIRVSTVMLRVSLADSTIPDSGAEADTEIAPRLLAVYCIIAYKDP